MCPVRYGLNSHILFRRNEGPESVTQFLDAGPPKFEAGLPVCYIDVTTALVRAQISCQSREDEETQARTAIKRVHKADSKTVPYTQ